MNLFLVPASIVKVLRRESGNTVCLEVRRGGGGSTLFFHISSRKKKERIALGACAGSNLIQAPPKIGSPAP